MSRRSSARISVVVVIALSALATAYFRQFNDNSVSERQFADFEGLLAVTKVVDGDTIEVSLADDSREPVRLIRIDTPERDEPYYQAATDALKALIENRPVRLEFEKSAVERDQYDRLLAYVILSDGSNANIEMVRLGWSAFYTKFGKGRLAADFRRAEAEARVEKRGIFR